MLRRLCKCIVPTSMLLWELLSRSAKGTFREADSFSTAHSALRSGQDKEPLNSNLVF